LGPIYDLHEPEKRSLYVEGCAKEFLKVGFLESSGKAVSCLAEILKTTSFTCCTMMLHHRYVLLLVAQNDFDLDRLLGCSTASYA
jgi:hypothetical protein